MNLLPALALVALASDDVCSARLDNLLSLYREYELPAPLPDAQLVWMKVPRGQYLTLSLRTQEEEKREKSHGYTVKLVKPEPASLADTDLVDLDFVLHCHARGWKSLSCAAFRKWLAKAELRAERQLARDAWDHWLGRISGQETPLPHIAKHLKHVLPRTGLADERNAALVRSLELAANPSGAAPGSDDALIDQLIDRGNVGLFGQSEAYKALPRRGFAAIPALIAHLGDERLTRYSLRDLADNRLDFLRVKDVVYQMLCDFAGKQLTESNDLGERTLAAGRWFADALKMDEEEYVVANVGQRECAPDDDVLFPLLVEKYPRRLPEAYRNFIEKQTKWDHYGSPFAKAIVEAPIPQEEKLKVLEFAATHANRYHRRTGLRFLLQLDPKRGSELLVAALEKLAANPEDVWVLAPLVGTGLDPKAWEALEQVAKRVAPDVRAKIFAKIVTHWDDPTPEHRRLQLAFIASHLTDTDSWDVAYDLVLLREYCLGEPLSQNEVRNYAALRILFSFRLCLQPPSNWTAQRWGGVRECARIELEHHSRR